MFGMIRNTEPAGAAAHVVAYSDNASVMEGHEVALAAGDGNAPVYAPRDDPRADEGGDAQPPDGDLALPGAATGAGGEIRDEGATGRGSRPKAGLTGFTVSNLHLPAR